MTIIVTLAGNLAPATFMLSAPGDDAGTDPASGLTGGIVNTPSTQEFTFATVDATGTASFARLSILWVELNGKRVTADEWGSGHITELKFQVGLKAADARGLRMGDSFVPVRPTDTFTIHGFTGRYQVANIHSSSATLSLQGTVAVTAVNEGTLKGLQTLTDAKPGTRENLAYVVIQGQRSDAISFTHADSARAYTRTEAGSQTPGHLGARAVRINGEDVLENAWGDGTLTSIGFDVVVPEGVTETVSFNGKDLALRTGMRVEVREFVGSYVVYQVAGGLQKIKLDGVAKSVSTNGTALSTGPLGALNRAPVAQASYLPLSPTTSTAIRFVDDSVDPDVGGFVLFRSWDFGDGSGPSSEARPTHRYTQKGTYNVTLTVTDNALAKNTTTFQVIVDNSPPHTDFNWYPKVPTTFFDIPFQDLSRDVDGSVATYHWDFGDGATSVVRNPIHQYRSPGTYNVTLTTSDNEGAYNSVTKVIVVQNSPPRVGFRWTPAPAISVTPITFIDESEDLDGFIVKRIWNFPGNEMRSGPLVNFTFPRSGTYRVTLTITDNDGATLTVPRDVQVLNSPPVANFTYPDTVLPASDFIRFEDRSVDRDGQILNWTWDFGDGNVSFAKDPFHSFARHGNYSVTLTVTDDQGARDQTTRVVPVDYAAPRAKFDASPRVVFTNERVAFIDRSTHTEGRIVRWQWEFGDNTTSASQHPDHIFRDNCFCRVMLTVWDEAGRSNSAVLTITVLNRAPLIDALHVFPNTPVAGDAVSFSTIYRDMDGTVAPSSVTWQFGDADGAVGANVTHVYALSGEYTVRVNVVDDDGAKAERTLRITVLKAPPRANFTYSPLNPVSQSAVRFQDTSKAAEDPIVEWVWTFGDSTGETTITSPSHTFTQGGTYSVTLRIRDAAGNIAQVTKDIRVNGVPFALFSWTPFTAEANLPVTFRDLSRDDTGIKSWVWTFGPYGSSTDRNPVFTFEETGIVDVTLAVTDLDNVTRSRTARVLVVNSPPEAAFTYAPVRPIQNQDVHFTDLSRDKTGPISQWEWDFDDGTFVSTQNATHRFSEPGYYDVRLSVRDMDGQINATSSRVRVTGATPYHIDIVAVLPDGTRIHLLNTANVEVTVQNLVTKQKLSLSRNVTRFSDGSARASFGVGEWAPGDRFEVYVYAGGYGASRKVTTDYSADLAAGHPVEVHMQATLRLHLEVIPPATQSPLTPLDPSPPGLTTFTMPDEPVRVRARVTWLNGDPVYRANVRLYTTWTVTREEQPVFQGAIRSLLTTSSDIGTTDADGYTIIVVPPPPDELGFRLVYPPGWYWVTGDATVTGLTFAGLGDQRPYVSFYQDPGGVTGYTGLT